MALSESRVREYIQRLLVSRMRMLCTHGFYGLLLMHMKYAVDESVETACTDGDRIIFGTDFLEGLTDGELDFVMMHEIMHAALSHCLRSGELEHERYNIAADIVVNSTILLECGMDERSITLQKYGVSMHLAPDGKEGHLYTAEQVYAMLPETKNSRTGREHTADSDENDKNTPSRQNGWDIHDRWGMGDDEQKSREQAAVWGKRLKDAAEAVSVRDPSNSRGLVPAFARRILGELERPHTNWRQVLCEFVSEEINDYSFFPPDRRFDSSPFYLPDFNEKEDRVEDVLFMIDTSGSMSDRMITQAYSEIKGAIDQFGGKLCGWLGFFDAAVTEPTPFESEDQFRLIRPRGGGGTDFGVVFSYVSTHMKDTPPVCIIILTDGYAPFPDEKSAGGIPVLWMINNTAITPPWGKIARITD